MVVMMIACSWGGRGRGRHARRERQSIVGFEWDDDAGARPELGGTRCSLRVCARACVR